MSDGTDRLTAELPTETPTKHRDRPAVGREAMSPAKRKREQRIRQAEAIQEKDSDNWSESECLSVLSGRQWRSGTIDKAAWLRLGKLREFA